MNFEATGVPSVVGWATGRLMPLLLQPAVRIEPPPPGLAQGKWDVPRPAIIVLGVVLTLAGLFYFAARLKQRSSS